MITRLALLCLLQIVWLWPEEARPTYVAPVETVPAPTVEPVAATGPQAAPAATSAQWQANPLAAANANTAQATATAATAPSGFWQEAATWGLGALAALIGIGRVIGGGNPLARIGTGIAEGLWRILADDRTQAAEAKRDQIADGLNTVWRVVEDLPPEVGAIIKPKLAVRMPSVLADAAKEWLAENNRPRT
jgi:hypothetical protein